MENVLKANRKGRSSLKRRGCDAVGHSSYNEISMSSENDFVDSDRDITNETRLALQLVEDDVNSESKLYTSASLQETEGKLNPAVLFEESDEEWDTIDLTDSQVKNLENLEEAAMSVVQPLVKEEPQSNDDIQFMGEFVNGSYDGPRILAESIKQEFISASDLEAYNKNVDDKNKLVLVQEKICNVCDVCKVYRKEQLEELLKGVHGNRYRRNIAHVESLKENIAQSLKEKDMSSCGTLEDTGCNREKQNADEARKVAEFKEKEDADARNAEEERHEKELEEARKVAELKEKEDADARKAEERCEKELEEARKAAELKEKEDTDARKAAEERQKELEEARKVAELTEEEEKEKQDTEAQEKWASLEAEEAIREADEKKRQEEEE